MSLYEVIPKDALECYAVYVSPEEVNNTDFESAKYKGFKEAVGSLYGANCVVLKDFKLNSDLSFGTTKRFHFLNNTTVKKYIIQEND